MAGLVTFQDWWARWIQQVAIYGNNGSLKIELFKNDRIPAPTDVVGDYIPADFHGYTPFSLDNWGSPVFVGNTCQITHATIVWTRTTGSPSSLVYGYYVTSDDSGELYWAERNPFGAVNMNTVGQTYVVTPKIYDGPAPV